jgi:prevent-host-death family protein
MEINAKQARAKISEMLDKVEEGEEWVIVRRGKKVARLIPFKSNTVKGLPDLNRFRGSIAVHKKELSKTVVQAREEERF